MELIVPRRLHRTKYYCIVRVSTTIGLAEPDRIELAQIDGGGEGVLPTLTSLAQRYAKQRGLNRVEWVVHALNCTEPNMKLRRVMERRGFQIVDVEGVGKAYYLVMSLDD